MSKFWTRSICPCMCSRKSMLPVIVPYVQASITHVVAGLHTPTLLFIKAGTKKEELRAPSIFPKHLEMVSVVLLLRHRALGCAHRRNLMFDRQKHLVELQKNRSFSPATFNSKPIQTWLCAANWKRPSQTDFVAFLQC